MDDSAALSVAFVPGVTVTKWTRIWAERHPETPLIILPTDQPQQVSVVLDGTAQLSFVRLPIAADGLHVIPLYRERAVVVAAKDHAVAAVDSVTLADLAGETRQTAGTKHADRDAFDLVAAGVGVLVVPQSIARLQSRKDVVVRPVTDAPETQIALVWRADADAGAEPGGRADLIEEFVGIVRGRTARSSRSAAADKGTAGERQPAKGTGTSKGTAKGTAKGAAKASGSAQRSGTAQRGGAGQRGGAAHAMNRKRADAKKKRRGR